MLETIPKMLTRTSNDSDGGPKYQDQNRRNRVRTQHIDNYSDKKKYKNSARLVSSMFSTTWL